MVWICKHLIVFDAFVYARQPYKQSTMKEKKAGGKKTPQSESQTNVVTSELWEKVTVQRRQSVTLVTCMH